MSLLDFQKTLALMVRHPEQSLTGLVSQLSQACLSEEELHSLTQLDQNPLVRKFATKMRFVRQREALAVMRLSCDHIPKGILNHLYLDCFEPTRTGSDPLWLGVEFLEFLLKNDLAQRALSASPDYVLDLLQYDHAKALVCRKPPNEDAELPKESLLRYAHFVILHLKYDVPAYDRAKWSSDDALLAEKPMTLLFISRRDSPFYRTFQIDLEVEAFLVAQKQNPALWKGPLPAAFDAMVRAGLCRLPKGD